MSSGIYDPKKSTTFKNMSDIQFGGPELVESVDIEGNIGTDTLNIGGATCPNFPFGLASNYSYNLGSPGGNRSTDGNLGMAFSKGGDLYKPLTTALIEVLEPTVPSGLFATSLKTNGTGSLDIGQVDKSSYKGDVTTINVGNNTGPDPGRWNIESLQLGIQNQVFDGSFYTELNTLNTRLIVPSSVLTAYIQKVPGALNLPVAPVSPDLSGLYVSTSNWTYPCNQPLPDLYIYFNSTTMISGPAAISIPGSAIGDDNPGHKTMCTPKMESNDLLKVNLGLPFYTTKYLIWNYDGPTLGIADQA